MYFRLIFWKRPWHHIQDKYFSRKWHKIFSAAYFAFFFGKVFCPNPWSISWRGRFGQCWAPPSPSASSSWTFYYSCYHCWWHHFCRIHWGFQIEKCWRMSSFSSPPLKAQLIQKINQPCWCFTNCNIWYSWISWCPRRTLAFILHSFVSLFTWILQLVTEYLIIQKGFFLLIPPYQVLEYDRWHEV